MYTLNVRPIGSVKASKAGMQIVLKEEYIPALQELHGFSHLNIIWWFSEVSDEEGRHNLEVKQPYKWSPAIMGVFATRSPFRPNPIALTSVQVNVIDTENGVIHIPYIDAHDGTPILDIKPYTPSLDRVESPKTPEWCRHWPKSLEQSADFDWQDEFQF